MPDNPNELKPCPWCGLAHWLRIDVWQHPEHGAWIGYVECQKRKDTIDG